MYQIRDTVHGYIDLDYIYADIVDTPEFQRLRSIEQGSFRPVFPGARHDRFIHSLGTYHLATRFVRHFFRNIREDVSGYCLTVKEEKSLTATFRYAALLHDIGHAPYSHTTEDFFRLKKNAAGQPVILDELRAAVASAADAQELAAFDQDFPKCKPSSHEIISATLLISEKSRFLGKRTAGIDLALAARMVIGCVYDYNRYDHLNDHDKQLLGVRNCLIRLLNSSAVDVDRLDYLIRDTQMSGFVNTPVDVERLASSVTAVGYKGTDRLYPAFRNSAIGVLESMFHAKREHDFWVLCHPTGAYDAALRAHCIRRLDTFNGNQNYMTTIFTAKALGRTGVRLAGRPYRLLCDDDIGAELKRRFDLDPIFQELSYRDARRVCAWKDYYEYRWLFHDPAGGVTEADVFRFFQPLIAYMEEKNIFQLDLATYNLITSAPDASPAVRDAADFLYDFFAGLKVRAAEAQAAWNEKKGLGKPEHREEQPVFDIVLLQRTVNLSYKFDPAKTYISFPRQPGRNGMNYTSFAFLKDKAGDPDAETKQDKRDMFYLFARKFVMTESEKEKFRDAIQQRLRPAVAPAFPGV